MLEIQPLILSSRPQVNQSSDDQEQPKQKSQVSCIPCRQKRQKCDRTLPHCNRCKRSIYNCEYRTKKPLKFKHLSIGPELKHITDKFARNKKKLWVMDQLDNSQHSQNNSAKQGLDRSNSKSKIQQHTSIDDYEPTKSNNVITIHKGKLARLTKSHAPMLLSTILSHSKLSGKLVFTCQKDLIRYILFFPTMDFSQFYYDINTQLASHPVVIKLFELDRIHSSLSPSSSLPTKLIEKTINSKLDIVPDTKYWEELTKAYFQYFHTTTPIFSLRAFDHSKLPSHLLLAIQWAGFNLSPTHFDASIAPYINDLMERELKTHRNRCQLSVLQMMLIYYSMKYSQNCSVKNRAYLGHITRLSWGLGLHLDHSKSRSEDFEYECKMAYRLVIHLNMMNSGRTYRMNFVSVDPIPLPYLDYQYQLTHSDASKNEISEIVKARSVSIATSFTYEICSAGWGLKFPFPDAKDNRVDIPREQNLIKTQYEQVIVEYRALLQSYPDYKEIPQPFILLCTYYYQSIMMYNHSNPQTGVSELSKEQMEFYVSNCNQMLKTVNKMFTKGSNGWARCYKIVGMALLKLIAYLDYTLRSTGEQLMYDILKNLKDTMNPSDPSGPLPLDIRLLDEGFQWIKQHC